MVPKANRPNMWTPRSDHRPGCPRPLPAGDGPTNPDSSPAEAPRRDRPGRRGQCQRALGRSRVRPSPKIISWSTGVRSAKETEGKDGAAPGRPRLRGASQESEVAKGPPSSSSQPPLTGQKVLALRPRHRTRRGRTRQGRPGPGHSSNTLHRQALCPGHLSQEAKLTGTPQGLLSPVHPAHLNHLHCQGDFSLQS